MTETGYQEAMSLAKTHYENFPVVSLLVPARLKKHIAIVYWFARTADDFSDEGNVSDNERLEKLDNFEARLASIISGKTENNLEAALSSTINSKNLNPDNFFNLLKAFKQDVVKHRYQNFNEVLAYCSNSANPVGRILLELFGIRKENAIYFSDKICTALQITNFIQDTKIDYQKGRIYYPQDEMKQYQVEENMFEMNRINLNLKQLIEFSVNRIQGIFDEGKGLIEFLSGRFKYEIALTINGGEEILRKIRGVDFDVLSKRQYLTRFDYMKLFLKSFIVH